MKITCVIGPFLPVPPVRGGAVERIFLALCEEFAKLGHEVTMVSRRFGKFPHDEVVKGVRHIRIASHDAPANRIVYRLLDLKYAVLASKALPTSDITITNSVSLPLVIPKRRAGKIYVSVARYPKNHMGIYRRVDRLQGVSTHITSAIKEQSPSVAHLVSMVPNCLSETFAHAISDERGVRSKQILYVGRIAREKGIHLLVAAFAALRQQGSDWTLKIVGPHEVNQGGDGSELLAELKVLAGPALEHIEFVGPIYDEDKLSRVMMESEIFVYPSVAERGESFGLAPVEAMACGCAVVLSQLKCFNDYLVDGKNGVLFDHSDTSGGTLLKALMSLTGDQALRETLSAEAVATARAYTPAKVAEMFIDDFKKLVK